MHDKLSHSGKNCTFVGIITEVTMIWKKNITKGQTELNTGHGAKEDQLSVFKMAPDGHSSTIVLLLTVTIWYSASGYTWYMEWPRHRHITSDTEGCCKGLLDNTMNNLIGKISSSAPLFFSTAVYWILDQLWFLKDLRYAVPFPSCWKPWLKFNNNSQIKCKCVYNLLFKLWSELKKTL